MVIQLTNLKSMRNRFGYFNNTVSKLAGRECPHVDHGGRVKGLNLVEWEPKCFQFYRVCHSLDMSLTPFNQFPFQGHALIKPKRHHSYRILQWIVTTKHLTICDKAIHLLNTQVTVPRQISGNCINIPYCHSHVAFLSSLTWHTALIGHFDDWHENEVCYLCLTRIFTTDQKIFIPRSMPSMESIT